MAESGDAALAEQFRRYVSEGKQEARNGNLEESIRLFRQALEIHPSEKVMANIKKLEEALASLTLDQEDDDFVDVCQSGLMLYGEMYDKLFDHQREGVAFLYSLYRDGRKGGILADDMGLGKTIQIIAFLSGMFDAEYIRSVLLIVPTTLISNWTREFASWAPGLRVKVFHGPCIAERTRNLERVQRRHGVVLTTYHMLLNNWQQLSTSGTEEFFWDYVILDEAHKIKTPSAKMTKCAHAIPSKNRILLTGTPVQNNLKELWALFDFACQGSLLGTMKTFRMEYENPITTARAKDATPGERALGLKISENLMSIIKPYFLRRSKDELQKKVIPELKSNLPAFQSKDAAPAMPSLPRKNEFIVWVFLAPIQEEIYRKFLSLDHIKELLTTTRSPLAELNVLKKLCDHPRLLSARACSQLGLEASDYNEPDGGETEADEHLHRNIEHISDEILIKESGKLRFLVALLERLQEEGHRTLVFSRSRKMLDIIERILTHRRFKLMRIDGKVTHLMEREKRIGMFQESNDYSVFLLTTQVGGVGLTLTAATRVVIFDPSWNPATDAQAVDRAYRIGQKANVVIYRLITCGTVEEKIYRRQVFKDSLIRQSTGDKKNPFRYFTMQELRELFILEDARSSLTQLQLQSLHASQRKTDTQLDEHIAYLHSLEIFGISDHDLMYTHETVHEDEVENEEDQRYIEHRVQKAQELVQLESQLNNQLIGSMRNTTEGAWLREMELSTQPKKKTPKPSQNHALSASVLPTNNEVVTLVTDDDDDDDNNKDDNGSNDIVNVSSKMTRLDVEDVDDERILRDISNMDMSLSKNEEYTSVRIQDFDREQNQSTVSSFPQANKENCHPKFETVSHDLLAQDVDNEQMLQDKSNMDISLSRNEECKSAQLQEHDPKAMSPLPTTPLLSNKENCSPGSQRISCALSAEANMKSNDVQVEPLQQSYESISGDKQLTRTELSPNVVRKLYEVNSEDSLGYKKNPVRRIVSDDEEEPYDLVINDDDSNGSDAGEVINISSRLTSLHVEDMDDEQMLRDTSNMDISLSKTEECKSASSQRNQSNVSPFPQANLFSSKDNCHPEFKLISQDLPAQHVDNEQMLWDKSNMDISLSKNEESKSAQLQEREHNLDLKAMSSFLTAPSLSNKENSSHESQRNSSEPSAKVNIKGNDVEVEPLQWSSESVSGDKRQVTRTELSSDVARKPYEEACEIYELDAAVSFQPQPNNISMCTAEQESEMMLQNESLTTPSPYQANFNLVLEDSEDELQVVSKEEMSLEETSNEGFQLRMDSRHSSASHSWAGENEDNGSPPARKNVMGSMLLGGSHRLSDALMDNSEVSFYYKKKPVRRIVSDDEEEQIELITEQDDSKHGEISALHNVDVICMSTPKSNGPVASLCFSPRVKVSGRRSTASRRSLANLVMDQVEDVVEVVESESDVPPVSSSQNNTEKEMIQISSRQDSTEPLEETLDSENRSSYLYETASIGDESSL
ncbi:LOW QUALITY PROTEIN: DNA excision repair protein ERCC-6-like [Sceloporus undulatus]|uniref:LOW QUALITY PROTEIN: DNA excision repair protein ERCC-6-like n=1 Tax=Sceloporus undulatus TaxID=8520 RepID=UPI001C4BFA46|nr:LOW QUALITY PROTEIN: DNA excision repair protein ERCC-6-like [Sceloporus undulatus]